MPGEILLQNPYYEYAISFMELCYRKYGLKSVCFYTNPAERREQAWKFPALQSEMVAASYTVDVSDLSPFTTLLKRRHDIRAVIPFCEEAVLPASSLAEELGLSWAQPEVVSRFRDKAALKQFLLDVPDGPRINQVTVVHTVADIRTACLRGRFSRFVLKPNDGTGNQQVGFFDAASSDEQLQEYLTSAAGQSVLLEEFIEGNEYFVNGQVDALGNVTILSAFECMVTAVNGRDNVPSAFRIVNTFEDTFDPMAAYATDVIKASGLRRSPFHVDLKIDSAGPCLIEAGARLAGVGTAYDISLVHGGDLDVFDLAAHYYLSADPYDSLALDWEHYDARAYAIVLGIAYGRGLMYEVHGTSEVEHLPGFVRWGREPSPGRLFKPTVDLYSVPWILSLSAPDQSSLMDLSERAHRLLRWNDQATGVDKWRKISSAVWTDVKKKANELPTKHSLKPTKVS